MTSIGIIGECMIELSRAEGRGDTANLFQKRYGGDTYNTAYYLAQCAKAGTKNDIDVHYVTALGDDEISSDMISTFAQAGVQTDCIEQVPGAVPGLYAIQTDDHGERSFLYWRSEAPVRKLFQTDGADTLKASLLTQDWLYFSGISLAILYPEGRRQLFELCREFRSKGGKIAFDINYRPRLWESVEDARDVINQAYRLCDLALPSYDDEKLLFGVSTPGEAIERIKHLAVGEIVLKNGAEDISLYRDGSVQQISIPAATEIKDTTAAGDSFNAGYIWARLKNKSTADAISTGGQLARQVIAQVGAIVPVTPPAL